MSDIKTTSETAIAEAGRPPVVIDPGNVQRNVEGFAWHEYLVRLPRHATLHDLNDPRIWRLVQSASTSLRKLDRVRIVSFDESWLVEAVVVGATRAGVTLSRPQKIDLAPRTEILAGDDTYQIRWNGNGYVVERRADGHFMSTPVETVQQAERDLRNLYPQSFVGRL